MMSLDELLNELTVEHGPSDLHIYAKDFAKMVMRDCPINPARAAAIQLIMSARDIADMSVEVGPE